MANMVSRLQTLKLVFKQPEPTSVFKFLDAIRPKTLAEGHSEGEGDGSQFLDG
jgi:hypothetical protein